MTSCLATCCNYQNVDVVRKHHTYVGFRGEFSADRIGAGIYYRFAHLAIPFTSSTDELCLRRVLA